MSYLNLNARKSYLSPQIATYTDISLSRLEQVANLALTDKSDRQSQIKELAALLMLSIASIHRGRTK